MSRLFKFTPREDITTYELATILRWAIPTPENGFRFLRVEDESAPAWQLVLRHFTEHLPRDDDQ